ncbi:MULTISPECIES: hypothetical protein [unclassified Curtobacterium]|uniref:hypothetical protein n=1 Tax=unclassified Curtobacterium TaxID=257496 RepID=UPI0011B4669F|nr:MULTISPECIES: hypothetical protein [unclassified Curtobacterium]
MEARKSIVSIGPPRPRTPEIRIVAAAPIPLGRHAEALPQRLDFPEIVPRVGRALALLHVHPSDSTTVVRTPRAVRSGAQADSRATGQAQNIWAIEPGRGDRWAQTGRLSPTHGQDPNAPAFGATAFGTDGVPGDGKKHSVDDHNVLTDDHRGYLDTDTESLYNIGQATTGHPEAMTRHEPKGMTWYEKSVLEQMQGQP